MTHHPFAVEEICIICRWISDRAPGLKRLDLITECGDPDVEVEVFECCRTERNDVTDLAAFILGVLPDCINIGLHLGCEC